MFKFLNTRIFVSLYARLKQCSVTSVKSTREKETGYMAS